MQLKYHVVLLVFCSLFALSLLLTFLSYDINVDSQNDILFETNTLFVLVFIFVISRRTALNQTYIRYGFFLLMFNQAYDVITEWDVFDRLADQHDFAHTMIEDGSQQIAYLLIAYGLILLIKRMDHDATIDELTGLYNRKKLKQVRLAQFDLIYFDLDGLKKINDSQGHAAGDLLIIRFGQVLQQTIHGKEQAFRIGGDEFVVVAKAKHGRELVQRVENTLNGEEIKFSYGIETTRKQDLYQALNKTDQAMYEMKNSQRQG